MGLDQPIDITAEQRKILLALLERHLPNTTAWVYGSRVKWTSRPQSDLDLVVFAAPDQERRVSDLREAFEESNLPFRVDLFVWDSVPEQFHKQIEAEHVVLVEREELGMAGEWVRRKIGALGRVVTGKTPSTADRSNFDGSYPFITIPDLDGRVLIDNTERTLSDKGAATLRTCLLPPGAVLMSCIATVGRCGVTTRPSFTNQQINSVIPGVGVDSRFLYYVFTQLGHDLESSGGGGSVYTNVSKSRFSDIEVLIPDDLTEQRAIAHILGTLDDKIELNRRMNETLEAMAQALFKSWFVDFDPVRAKAVLKRRSGGGNDWTLERARAYLDSMNAEIAALFPDSFVDSELGEIPEGWGMKELGECFDLTMGQSPPGSTYNEHGEGLPFFQGRSDFGFRFPENRKFCTVPTRIAQPGDTLVSVRAPVGDINMAWEKCCIGRGVAALRHKSDMISFTYYSAWRIQEQLREYEHTGTVFGAINKSQFEALRVIEPDPSIVNAFDSCAQPLDATIRSSTTEFRTLSTLRDGLLSKLISGQLRVGEMMQNSEKVM